MNKVRITPSKLNGYVEIPSSKSLCHRAIIAAGLAPGASNVENVIFSDDITATCNGMKAFGIKIQEYGSGLKIEGLQDLQPSGAKIDCMESGSTLRFLIPVALLSGEKVTFNGRGRLKERPLTPFYKIFEKQNIYFSNDKGLPLTLQGKLKHGRYELEGNISSQFITGLLLTLPLLEESSEIIITTELESKGYVDLTMDILRQFSITVENHSFKKFYIPGNQKYVPRDYKVEGDFSQAAFWLIAGIIGGQVECRGLNENSLQGDKAIMDILRDMGGSISIDKNIVRTAASKTKGIIIDAAHCPDLVPILAVLGALSEGTTEIINAGRLRIKESDRLKAIATELNKIGADVKEKPEGLIIYGKNRLKGGTVDGWNDHRIVMALAIASIRSDEPVVITGSDAVKKSYPGFFKDFSMLGGIVNEWNMGQQD